MPKKAGSLRPDEINFKINLGFLQASGKWAIANNQHQGTKNNDNQFFEPTLESKKPIDSIRFNLDTYFDQSSISSPQAIEGVPIDYGVVSTEEKDINKIINAGENKKVEFKSSLRWDYHQNKMNSDLEFEVTKEINAFLNSEGGLVFIGIDDNGIVLGLENDFTTLGSRQNIDGFSQKMDNVINDRLGSVFHNYIKIIFDKIDGKDICIVQVKKGDRPSYVKNLLGSRDFYIRCTNSCSKLGVDQVFEYISSHWST